MPISITFLQRFQFYSSKSGGKFLEEVDLPFYFLSFAFNLVRLVGDGELCRSIVRIIAALVEWDGLILHGYVSLRDCVVVPRDFGVV